MSEKNEGYLVYVPRNEVYIFSQCLPVCALVCHCIEPLHLCPCIYALALCPLNFLSFPCTALRAVIRSIYRHPLSKEFNSLKHVP